MPKMTINTEHMATTSSQLRTGAANLLTDITTFRGLVSDLLAEGWVAPSGSAFDAAYSSWHAAANQMTTALQEISAAVNTASTNFASADTASTVH